MVVTTSFDKTVRLWDSVTGELIGKLEGHNSIVWHAAFNRESNKLVTASYDGTGRIRPVFSDRSLLSAYAREIAGRDLYCEERSQFSLIETEECKKRTNANAIAK